MMKVAKHTERKENIEWKYDKEEPPAFWNAAR
jgi:hypothetical protein